MNDARLKKLLARKQMLTSRGETLNYNLLRKINRNIRKEDSNGKTEAMA